MTPISTVIGQLVALLGLIALLVVAPRSGVVIRFRAWIAVGLATLALCAYFDFGRFHGGNGLWTHYWDTYHYHVPTKYFAELGYDGLYDATVVADTEDDPGGYVAQIPVRSLRTYEIENRGAVMQRAAEVRARFSPERWEAFKQDIAFYRGVDPIQWRNSVVLIDHGYNGTPLVTSILGTLGNLPGIPTGTLVTLFSFSDYVLLGLLALFVAWRMGVWEAALLVFAWAANPLNDFQVIGGAPIRSLHVLALLAAAIAMRRGCLWASGAGVGLATVLRVLPGGIAAMTVAWTLLGRARAEREKLVAAWVLGALVVGALAVGVGAANKGPDERIAWLPFVEKVTLHGNKLSPNIVTMRYPFLYSGEHNASVVEASWPDGARLNWVTESTRTLAERWRWYQLAGVVMALGFAWLLRRGRPEDAWIAGLFIPFAALSPSHYDQAVLCVLPVLFAANRAVVLTCFGGFAALCVARLIPSIEQVLDARFLVQSVVVWGIFVALLLVRLWQVRGDRDDGAGSSAGD